MNPCATTDVTRQQEQTMSNMDKMRADRDRHTPVSGFNLVGLEVVELPGEQLYLIGNFPTMEDALNAQAAWSHSDKTYIYEPKARNDDPKNP